MRLPVGPSRREAQRRRAADEVELAQGELLGELSLHAQVGPWSAPGPDEALERQTDAPVGPGQGGGRAVRPERHVGVVDQLGERGDDDVTFLLGHARELARGVLQADGATGLIEEAAGPVAVAAAERDEAEEERRRLGGGGVGASGLEQRDGDRVLAELVAGDALQEIHRRGRSRRPRASASARSAPSGSPALQRVGAGLDRVCHRRAGSLEAPARLDRCQARGPAPHGRPRAPRRGSRGNARHRPPGRRPAPRAGRPRREGWARYRGPRSRRGR